MTEWKHGHEVEKNKRIDNYIKWRDKNPNASKADCMKKFSICRTTIYNYDREIKRRLDNDKM